MTPLPSASAAGRPTGHDVGQVLALLAVALPLQADRGPDEEERRDQHPADPDPGDKVRPIKHGHSATLQQLKGDPAVRRALIGRRLSPGVEVTS